MPAFDVIVRGKQYRVEIPDPGASPLQVIVDGQVFDVDIAVNRPSATPSEGVEPAPPAPPAAAKPTPLPPMPNFQGAQPVSPAASGAHDVIAPMPGTILSIQVSAGQPVEPGQVVCVLEAMKMKNPIRATIAATVAEVVVAPGASVAYGDILVRLA